MLRTDHCIPITDLLKPMPFAHFQVPACGGQIEDAPNRFLQAHRVVKVERHFLEGGRVPPGCWHLLKFVVTSHDGVDPHRLF